MTTSSLRLRVRVWWWIGAVMLVACEPAPAPILPSDASTDAQSDAAFVCASNRDCDDGLYCNGEEQCTPGAVGAPPSGCVAAARGPCANSQRCEEGPGCVTDCGTTEDADRDGVEATECGGTDCDDSNAAVYPGALEVCDARNLDEDCDPSTVGTRDADGDRSIDSTCCNGSRCGEDCNDARRSVQPLASEVCNAIDDDCDGEVDEGVLIDGFFDDDGDGRGDRDRPRMACPGARRFAVQDGDCDDDQPGVWSGAPEICDARDNDCDGQTDEASLEVPWYVDRDGDGWGTASQVDLPMESCAPIPMRAIRSGDCDDGDPQVSPTSPERCNGADDDCNGVADYEIELGDGEDDDRDGAADPRCAAASTDCNDRDALTGAANAPEICDARDNDCDSRVDERAAPINWHRDQDQDGYGDAADMVVSCEVVAGRLPRGGDCDDSDARVRPGAVDGCEGLPGVDDDCDSVPDDDEAPSWLFADADGDGWGSGETMREILACSTATGVATVGGDCAPDDPDRHPGLTELCTDGIDQDCDELADCDDEDCFGDPSCAEVLLLELVSGDAQSADIGQELPLPIVVRARELGGSLRSGVAVTMSASLAAARMPVQSTDASGLARFTVRAGTMAGPAMLRFSADGARPIVALLTVVAPAPGAIDTLVNEAHAAGFEGVPGQSAEARIGGAEGVAIASDGTVYVADPVQHRVYRVGADGAIEVLAGDGMAAHAGDSGPASMASVRQPRALALDEARDLLYVLSPDRVRVIRLGARTIDTFAGGGASTSDGVVATSASITSGCAIAVRGDGTVAYLESTRAREVSASSRQVRTIMFPAGPGSLQLNSVTSCALAARGQTWVIGAAFQGPEITGGVAPAIVTVDPGPGSVRRAAGGGTRTDLEGAPARLVSLSGVNGLAVDAGGNLYASEGVSGRAHRVLRLDAVLGTFSVLAGGTTAGASGDGADASQALLSSPRQLAVSDDRLVIADSGNSAVRIVRGLDTARSEVQLQALSSGFEGTVTSTSAMPLGTRVLSGGAPVTGVPIAYSSPEPALSILTPSGLAAAGAFSSVIVFPRLPGAYSVQARALDLWGSETGSLSLDVTARPPASGTMLTVLNAAKTQGAAADLAALPAAAVLTRISSPSDVVAASDGTLYAISYALHSVIRVSPEGLADRIGGSGGISATGDGMLATEAQIGSPVALALDEPRQRLYIAQLGGGWRIRVIDLQTGIIQTYAGNGVGTSGGNGGPAVLASFGGIRAMATGPSGDLWISDLSEVRRVAFDTGVIERVIASNDGSPSLRFCTADGIDVDPMGRVFLFANVFGTDVGPTFCAGAPAIIRRDPDGTLHRVAGRAGGPTADGTPADQITFTSAGAIDLDASGAIAIVDGHRVRRIDAMGRITTIAGTGTAGSSGDLGPATSASLDDPSAIDHAGGHLYIADDDNHALRAVW